MFRFERFVAVRYLRGAQGLAEGGRFLRFILYAAVGGVAVGVAALLLALAVVRGFSEEIQDKIIAFGAHVQVENLRDEPLPVDVISRSGLEALPGVASVSGVVTEFILLRKSARQIEGVSLWGTDAPPAGIASRIVEGSFALDADSSGRPQVAIGRALAERLGLRLGQVVNAFTLPEPGRSSGGARVRTLVVGGIYETNLANFDELYVFMGIDEARSLLGMARDATTRYDLTLADPAGADAVARQIEETFGFPVLARSVFVIYRSLFSWVELQQNIVPLVLSVLVLVSAFCIVGILFMLVLEKSREIGILSSMGASSRRVRRLYLFVGLAIGVAGACSGALFALAVAWLQLRYGFIPLPAEAYYIDRAPVALRGSDFVIVCSVSVLLCVLAAFLPARFASRLDPVRVLRFR